MLVNLKTCQCLATPGADHLRAGPDALARFEREARVARMKDKAIVGNIGHFDNEIDMAGLKKVPGIKSTHSFIRRLFPLSSESFAGF